MAPLDWQELPPDTSPASHAAKQQTNDPLMTGTVNPWFGITLGLVGAIVGYTMHTAGII